MKELKGSGSVFRKVGAGETVVVINALPTLRSKGRCAIAITNRTLSRGPNMNCAQVLNLVGLLCITVGSIAAALGSPSSKYSPDGSVSLAGEPDRNRRISTYRWQKNFRNFLFLVAFGAVMQVVAMFLPTGNNL
jgi:hypothetical protein